MDRRARRAQVEIRRRADRRATAAAVAAIVGLALLLYGAPVPRLSEELYLPLVRHTGDGSFLAGDWTMRGPFGEHWVFDHLFGPLAAWIPLPLFGWLGRILGWAAIATLLVRLGRRLDLGPAGAAAAVMLWLVANQALIGSDWMFGTFEAKTVADAFAIGALLCAMRARIPAALALCGATVSLHPGLGGWITFATLGALVADPATRRATLRWSWLTVAAAAPGVIAVLGSISSPPAELQRFVVLSAIPHHADPFFGGTQIPGMQVTVRLGLLLAMLATNVIWFRRSPRDGGRRFLIGFQLMSIVPVAVAFAARALEAWDFLLLQPLRMGPMLIPLFFFYGAVERIQAARRAERGDVRWWRRPSIAWAALATTTALVVTSPVLAAPRMIVRTLQAWTADDPEADAFRWLSDNSPDDQRCVVAPDRQDVFMHAERPIVANWQAIRYDALAEWRQRVNTLLDDPTILDDPPIELSELRAGYEALSAGRIEAVARRFDAGCIVSRTPYPFPVRHRVGPVRIYDVPEAPTP